MIDKDKFSDIRPLYDSEVPDAIAQLVNDNGFRKAAEQIIKPLSEEHFSTLLLQCKSKYDFQTKIVYPIFKKFIERTTSEMIGYGWENANPDKGHLYISNHRDIVLDAALFNILLIDQNRQTTEIAIGDNLLIHPWIENLVRINKSFIVKRDVSVRKMFEVSKHLSEYIYERVVSGNQSIWLAQREGRAKDSNDKTQVSLLKMLTLHSSSNPLEALKQLKITPLSISYEYDPCDYLKAKEFQLKRDNPNYQKSQADDIESMSRGIMGFKGRVNFRLGSCINPIISNIPTQAGRNRLLENVAEIIDREIYNNYTFFPINYIAYDMMNGSKKFSSHYSEEDRAEFNNYLDSQIEKIDIPSKDSSFLRQKIIEMYANTVKNQLKSS